MMNACFLLRNICLPKLVEMYGSASHVQAHHKLLSVHGVTWLKLIFNMHLFTYAKRFSFSLRFILAH